MELMYIITGPISPSQPKPSLINSLIPNTLADLAFYINNIYLAHSSFEK